MNQRNRGGGGLPKRLGAYSIAAGALALSATSSAEAGMQVFDHRAAPIFAITEYWLWDQTMVLMDVKTGDYQYIIEQGGNGGQTNGVNGVFRYDQDGFVDENLIPETDKTADTVWFGHRDMIPPGKGAAADGVTFETSSGGAAGRMDANTAQPGSVYVPGREDGSHPSTWSPHDWYWAHQDYDHDGDPGTPNAPTNGVLYPVDTAAGDDLHPFAADGSFSYNDSSPTGHTGVVTHGFGGSGHGSGSWFWVEDPYGSQTFSIPFKLDEADGTHYGWVAMSHNENRNRVWVHGWAYNTTPEAPAPLDWAAGNGCTCDLDGDGDVDADDIDLLCANMGGDIGTYDLDGNGVVDEDDMVYLVENLVEYDTDGDGTPDGIGTYRGDFNLDGVVNATDLQIMKGSFGLSGVGYAAGNANCDTVVNATDLQILKAKFGLSASAVPEPATLAVLALGASGVLAHRRRKNS